MTPLRILTGDFQLIPLRTRLPFKYGIAVMTEAPHVFVRVRVEIGGREYTGVSADLLPPKWFTKDPDRTLEDEVEEMQRVIRHALDAASGMQADAVYDFWRDLHTAQDDWGEDQELPPLLTQFGTSLVERAVIEAFAKSTSRPFHELARSNAFGLQLGDFDDRLTGMNPAELLPNAPRDRITARHTVGMADPLTADDVAANDRLDDGLPQMLEECISRYGLKHFKIKVSGDVDKDVERVRRIAAVVEREAGSDFAFSMDGNEQFRSADDFRLFWERLEADERLAGFFSHLMFLEQPFHRDVALDSAALSELATWTKRPPLIIDESDAGPGCLSRALSLGYHGTSHKNCKGVFKSIANACLLEKLRRDDPDGTYIMSGEDLANVGPVALLQDLAVAATLGVKSVERNGHHYFAGLSAFPESIQQRILEHHGDLYAANETGWPTLQINGGEIVVGSVNRAPFGVGFEA